MSARLWTLFTAVIVLAACQSDVDAPVAADLPNIVDLSPEQRDALKRYLADRNLNDGKWVEKDGVLMCEGFLTKFENEDHCSSGVPKDWVPFEYQGQEYYVQPLADKDRN